MTRSLIVALAVVACSSSQSSAPRAPGPSSSAAELKTGAPGGGGMADPAADVTASRLVATSAQEVTCGARESCVYSCPGGGCKINCVGGSSCAVDCAGGGCEVQCAGGASCSEACGGGRCETLCAGGSECEVTCEGGACEGMCAAGATCSGL